MDPFSAVILIGVGLLLAFKIKDAANGSGVEAPAPIDFGGADSFASFMQNIWGGNVADNSQDLVPQSSNGPTLQQWADAVALTEGSGRSTRNNNPGNLKYANQPGATGADPQGFAVFPSLELGMAALIRQLQKNLGQFGGLTLTQWAAHYLGQPDYLSPKVTKEGDPFAKASTIAQQLGVDANQTLNQIFGG